MHPFFFFFIRISSSSDFHVLRFRIFTRQSSGISRPVRLQHRADVQRQIILKAFTIPVICGTGDHSRIIGTQYRLRTEKGDSVFLALLMHHRAQQTVCRHASGERQPVSAKFHSGIHRFANDDLHHCHLKTGRDIRFRNFLSLLLQAVYLNSAPLS